MKLVKLLLVCVGIACCVGLYLYFSAEPQAASPGAAGKSGAPPATAVQTAVSRPANSEELARLKSMPDDVVLEPGRCEIPGKHPTWGLRYRNNSAKQVYISGTWDQWSTNTPMTKINGIWMVDLRPLKPVLGRNEFKFLPDEKWEKGDNRILYVNEEGMVERPDDLIFSATLASARTITLSFKRKVKHSPDINIRVRAIDGTLVPIISFKWIKGHDASHLTGFRVVGDSVVFSMRPAGYGLADDEVHRVSVAGTFNNWNANVAGWQLHKENGKWALAVATSAFGSDFSQAKHQFKFVVNGDRWLAPSSLAPNAESDGKGNINLRLDPSLSTGSILQIELKQALDLTRDYTVLLDGVGSAPAYHALFPLPWLDSYRSNKKMGVTLDKAARRTIFRLYAPRATKVDLCFYDGPEYRSSEDGKLIKPREVHAMQRVSGGVWEMVLPRLMVGAYYAYRVDGPHGPGEGFNYNQPLADPCARAVAHARNAAIVIDPDATNHWFKGWTDAAYQPPALKDTLIYETHVRDLTINPSSGVSKADRGRYAGVLETIGKGTGLDHLRKLGVNMIEFMPISEFENGTFGHSWGYGPAFYYAPEASYAKEPLKGSQYYEFKDMVNRLHNQGFGVIIDVVFNHVGTPNVFYSIDSIYYFRQNFEYQLNNFSGCGNDLRTEAPMMRRFIVDNILYWMREHHVDGFRFDLAELIDMKTLLEIEREARAINPNVILISEPWSFRGDHKRKLTNTGWSAWNNEFRDPLKYFIAGHGDRNQVMDALVGSGKLWTSRPLQAVNYLESHDDMCLTDWLSQDPKKDGMHLTEALAARSRLGTTLLFTSLGIPMLSEGQAYMRSKFGLHNTFDRGDGANALRWNERERPLARGVLDYYIGMSHLRMSDAGKSFRVTSVPDGYYRWITPLTGSALGYLVNASHQKPGAPFAVLVNASQKDVTFEVPFTAGRWLQVGNGHEIKMNGIKSFHVSGKTPVKVPKLTAYIFMKPQE